MGDLEANIDKALTGSKSKPRFSKMQRWILRGAAERGYFAPRDTRGFGVACRALERRGLVWVTEKGGSFRVDGVHLTEAGGKALRSLPEKISKM